MKAIVILSGGQDSVTCLYWAIRNYSEVEAIHFNYGQNHSIETEAAKKVSELEKIPLKIVDVSFLPELVNSALTSNGDVNQTNEKGLPASFVPNRNALFITLAHAYAQKINAKHLVTGVCQTDYSGYPDCRQDFIRSLEMTLNIGSDSRINIDTPLMFLNKAQTFSLADKLGKLNEVIELSHTCYNNDHKTKHAWGYGCGECPACRLRENGFKEFSK